MSWKIDGIYGKEIILPQITAVPCIVVLVVSSHQWLFCKVGWVFFSFWMHFHKAVLRRTFCAGSWMYFERHHYKELLNLNCKDGWSKKWGTVILLFYSGKWGRGEWLLWPKSPWESVELHPDLWSPIPVSLPYTVFLFPCCWFNMDMCNEPNMFCICLAKFWP